MKLISTTLVIALSSLASASPIIGARQSHWPTKTEDVRIWLCFEAKQANSTISMVKFGTPSDVNLVYSSDMVTESPFVVGTTIITLANVGDKVYFRSTEKGKPFANDFSNYTRFILSGKVMLDGNLRALIGETLKESVICPGFAFCCMFYGTSGLASIGNLVVGDLGERSAFNMFANCTSLETVGSITIGNMSPYSCQRLFYGCASLSSVGSFSCGTLAESSFSSAFCGCSNLTTFPDLTATVAAKKCYYAMFYESGLITAPKILLTTLVEECCQGMFANCSSLETVPLLAAQDIIDDAYVLLCQGSTNLKYIKTKQKTFDGCESWLLNAGTSVSSPQFVCPNALVITDRDENTVPANFTIVRED